MNYNFDQILAEQPNLKKILAIIPDARIIGGCVRDFIIGKQINDLDIATSYTPKELIKLFNQHQVKYLPTGIEFGTITALVKQQLFEITTLRKDIKCDGRHALVEFTDDWQLDASRRDFTINAMSYSFTENKLYDYFNGLRDLQNRQVKFIGEAEQRITEDYLRILRFFRFSAYYADKIDSNGVRASSKLAAHLTKLSKERIHVELLKILNHPKCSNILDIMHKNDILQYLLSKYQPKHFKFIHRAFDFEGFTDNINLIILAIIVKHNKESILATSHDLKLTNKQTKFLYQLIEHYNNFSLHNAKIIAFNHNKDFAIAKLIFEYAINENYDILSFTTIITDIIKWSIPNFPVKAEEIINLGIKPSKELGDKLKLLIKYWQDSDFTASNTELLNLIKQ